MSIPTMVYHGFEIRAYARQTYPPFGDPYAKGTKRFSAVVRIESLDLREMHAQRYATPLGGMHANNTTDAVEVAMQYGRDIIDGKVHAQQILGCV